MDSTTLAGVGALLLILTFSVACLLTVLAVTNATLMAVAFLLAALLRGVRRALLGPAVPARRA